jgi:hypothetical protein
MHVSNLRGTTEALGGTLEITARFDTTWSSATSGKLAAGPAAAPLGDVTND